MNSGSGSSADRNPFPGKRGRSNDAAPAIASAFNKWPALTMGVKFLVPENRDEHYDLRGVSAI
ncbi:MAG: hypothetical protein WCF30_15095 [Terracidiphilus sp.]